MRTRKHTTRNTHTHLRHTRRKQARLVDHVGKLGAREAGRDTCEALAHVIHVLTGCERHAAHMHAEDGAAACVVRKRDDNLRRCDSIEAMEGSGCPVVVEFCPTEHPAITLPTLPS